jgi:hypothetical protein
MTATPSETSVTKNFRWAGLVCALIGIGMFLYTGIRFMETMTQVDTARKNYTLVREQAELISKNPSQNAKLMQALSSSTYQLTLTNRRLKIAILGVSLVLAGAGGMLWFGSQRR